MTGAHPKKIWKLCLIGDARVGKTTLRKQYMGDKFNSEYMVTLGADFAVKNIELDGREVVYQIWDLAGQHRFAAIRDRYYHNASGLIVVFDLVNRDSFNNIPRWIDEYRGNNNNKLVPIVLIGNKVDLLENQTPAVTDEEVEQYRSSLRQWGKQQDGSFDIQYLKTSAKFDQNVQKAFTRLGEMMLEQGQ